MHTTDFGELEPRRPASRGRPTHVSVPVEPRAADAAPSPSRTEVDASTTRMRASLDTLVRLIERVAPGMRGSVLLLDDDGVTLRWRAMGGDLTVRATPTSCSPVFLFQGC